jgi:hypothetical protein
MERNRLEDKINVSLTNFNVSLTKTAIYSLYICIANQTPTPMKNIFHIKVRSAILIISTLLAIFVIRPASAQEKQKQDGEKTIKVKIIKDVDGSKTIIDTVFATDHPIDSKEFKIIMKNVNKQMREANEAMTEVDREMKNVHYEIALSMADSLLSDSLGKYKMKIITLGDDAMLLDNQDAYSYQFDAPCHDLSEFSDTPGQFQWQNRRGNSMYFNTQDKDEPTLSDVLGDIPMSRVKSYSIKDRKDGKRIIIDIDDAPLVEKQERVVYLKNAPGKSGSKIIIK